MIRTDDREHVEDAETETATDVLAFVCFRAESEGGLTAIFFLLAAEAELAPLKCVLMSLGTMIDFALSNYLLDVGFVGWRIDHLTAGIPATK